MEIWVKPGLFTRLHYNRRISKKPLVSHFCSGTENDIWINFSSGFQLIINHLAFGLGEMYPMRVGDILL